MQHLTLRITQQTEDHIAIRLMDAHGREQDRRALPGHEVRTWLRQTEEYYGDYFRAHVNNLAELGQRLFDWLNGEQRWLQTALQKYPDLTLSVSVDGDVSQATPKRLRHLPWELLYNGGWLCGHATRPFARGCEAIN